MYKIINHTSRLLPSFSTIHVPKRQIHPLIVIASSLSLKKISREHHSKKHIAIAIGAITGATGLYLLAHTEKVPITNRRHVVLFSDNNINKICDKEEKEILEQLKNNGYVLAPNNNPYVEKVTNISHKIIAANPLLSNLNLPWRFHVIIRADGKPMNQSEANACVLPNGAVYVFESIIPLVSNDDGLAVILAHELAHVVCKHGNESVGVERGLFHVSLAVMSFLGFDGFSTALGSIISRSLIECAHSRKCETEADFVGLELLRKTGSYNEKEAINVWNKFSDISSIDAIIPRWCNTHPPSPERAKNYEHWLKQEDLSKYALETPKLSPK